MSEWQVDELESGDIHNHPIEDGMEHELTESCWCGPDIEVVGDNGLVIAHHSLDGREHSEPDHDCEEKGCGRVDK